MNQNRNQPAFKVVVSGSFRRFYNKIVSKIGEFEVDGFTVESPKKSRVLDPKADFVVLESDPRGSPQEIEQKHLDAIYNADALYVVNPDGYIGNATALEIGWSLAFCKPIFYQEQCAEDLFTGYGRVLPCVRDVREFLQERDKLAYNTICRRTPVDLLQNYIRKVVIKRGFDKETPRDILLLMLEEVGELAKAVRKSSGLKVDHKKASTPGDIEEELADVFIYLLDLANSCDIDLFAAFYKKEIRNETRTWATHKDSSPRVAGVNVV